MYRIIIDRYLEMDVPVAEEELDAYCKEQDDAGFFRSVPLLPANEEEDFRFIHCGILRALASGYHHYRKIQYKKAVLQGLAAWQEMRFEKAANWFQNSIYIPRMLTDVLLFMGENIGEYKDFLIRKIEAAYSEERYQYDIGANIIWTNSILLHLACYKNDKQLLDRAIARINEEMRFADDHDEKDLEWRAGHWRKYVLNHISSEVYEGIQRDYSFFEHGPMLHTGAYGKGYLYSMIQLIYECHGMNLLSSNGIKLIIDYLLEHYRWAMRYGELDCNVRGRSIAAKGNHSNKLMSIAPKINFEEAVSILLQSKCGYREEALATLLEAIQSGKPTVEGLKYFPIGKYLVYQSKEYAYSIRMTCRNMLASESVNWENLKCWHLGDGVQYIYTDGSDYSKSFPVFDWKKIPGTTALDEEKKILDYQQHIAVDGSMSDLCGGLTFGTLGIAAMELENEDLSAKKAWFIFGEECVALGAGIKSKKPGKICTTVNQSQVKDVVAVKDLGAIGTGGKVSGGWLQHGAISYIFPDDEEWNYRKELVEGDWNDISYDQSPNRPETPYPCKEEMLTIWIEHDESAPLNSYMYKIVPCAHKRTPESKTKVLCNTETMQVIVRGQEELIVFWKPGVFSGIAGKEIIADRPMLVIVKGDEIKKAELSIKNAIES